MALVQYDYVIPPTSAIISPPSTPTVGDRVRVQADPDDRIFDGVIMSTTPQDGSTQKDHVLTLGIIIADDQPDIELLAEWLRSEGDLGIMLV